MSWRKQGFLPATEAAFMPRPSIPYVFFLSVSRYITMYVFCVLAFPSSFFVYTMTHRPTHLFVEIEYDAVRGGVFLSGLEKKKPNFSPKSWWS